MMGNDVTRLLEGLPSSQTIKVHARTCSELLKLVIMVAKIVPEIEAARPGCSSGIDALCLLKNDIDTTKSLLQHCSESSVLYLALTGDAIVSKCKKLRNSLLQSLGEIQNLVPVVLAAKVCDYKQVCTGLDKMKPELRTMCSLICYWPRQWHIF